MDQSGPGGHSSGRSVPLLHGPDAVVPPLAFLPVVLRRACGIPHFLAESSHHGWLAWLDGPSFLRFILGALGVVGLVHVQLEVCLGLLPGLVLALLLTPELYGLPVILFLVPADLEDLLVEALVSGLWSFPWRVRVVDSPGRQKHLRLGS